MSDVQGPPPPSAPGQAPVAPPVPVPAASTPPRPWGNIILLVGLLAAVSMTAAFLVSPGLYSQKIPEIGPADLGKPFRAPSASGLKAGRDYEVLDEARTHAYREEARRKVLPVFDYDPSVQAGVTRALREAFEEMQAVAEAFKVEKVKEDPNGAQPGKKKSETPGEAPLVQRLKEERLRFEQHVPLGDSEDDFVVLAQAGFSRELEQAALLLVEHAYNARLVGSREELGRVDEAGITMRVLGGTSESTWGTAAPRVMDLKEAQAELDRFASVPGNLLPEASQVLRRAVLRLAKRQLRPNITINRAETEARRVAAYEAVKPAVASIKKGQRVIGDGELINESHLLIVRGMRAQTDDLDVLQLQVGGAGVVALLILALWLFHHAAFRRFRPTQKDAAFMGLWVLAQLGSQHLWVNVADAVHDRYPGIPVEALYFLFPVAAGTMLVRFVLDQELALFFAPISAVLSGVLLGNSLSFGVFTLVASLVAADRVTRARDRAGIFRAGLVTGGAAFFAVLSLNLAEGKGVGVDGLMSSSFAFLGCAFVLPMVVMAFTPLVEVAFGYASDIKLLELANLNHPALKELVLQAPGTYHHSIIMGSLVEAAAESIGANALLARSCAYYHDIGKGRNPAFFGENLKGENPHDQLAPAMSAVIIKRHVTEGLEMARQFKLPRRVADAIPMHHGTRLVGYFFHKAQKEQEGRENPQPIDDAVYRYPGPKPQFREAALVMIADAVEASSRSMTEPTTDKLRSLVQRLVNMIFSEGQLDECDLTLKDLHLISESFVRTLEGIYHARPVYPPGAMGGQRTDGTKPTLALAPTPVVTKKAGA